MTMNSIPFHHFISEPRIGQMNLGGTMTDGLDTEQLATGGDPLLHYGAIRADVVKHSPVPVSRVAVVRDGRIYKGVIDSEGKPFLFALSSRGIEVRPASHEENAWKAFETLIDKERSDGLTKVREQAAAEFPQYPSPALVITKAAKSDLGINHKSYYRRDPRTGKMVYIKQKGHVAQHERGWLRLGKKMNTDPDDVGHAALDHLKGQARAPKNLDELHEKLHEFVEENFEGDTHGATRQFVQHLADNGGIDFIDMKMVPRSVKDVNNVLEHMGIKERLVRGKSYLYFDEGQSHTWHTSSVAVNAVDHMTIGEWIAAHDELAHDARDGGGGEEDEEAEEKWTERKPLAKPPLPKAWPAKGTTLIVGGKRVALDPDAEQAAFYFAKRFYNPDPDKRGKVKDQAKFMANFERHLRVMAKLPAGEIDYKHFISRIDKEAKEPKPKRGKAAPITPKSRPDQFVEQDGVMSRLVFGRIPSGGFYTGKRPPGDYGKWVRAVREDEVTINASTAPKGWKGKVSNDPSKDYYATWRHPITGDQGYILLSRAAADKTKFGDAQRLGAVLGKIRKHVQQDSVSDDHKVAAAALCTWLIDKETFRVGSEGNAKAGTFGVASFRAKHVSINGTDVRFQFIGKKDEPWDRTVDMSQMPAQLRFLKQCLKGKKPEDKLWAGDGWSVGSAEVNEYIKQASGEPDMSAKMFRTFHANRMLHDGQNRLDDAKKLFGLDTKQMEKLHKGFKVTDKEGKKLLAMKVKGKSLADFLELRENPPPKGKGVATIGIIPSVAARLGHTDGASRNSYMDPVVIVHWALKHGWDARTDKEKKTRDDLPGYVSVEADDE